MYLLGYDTLQGPTYDSNSHGARITQTVYLKVSFNEYKDLLTQYARITQTNEVQFIAQTPKFVITEFEQTPCTQDRNCPPTLKKRITLYIKLDSLLQGTSLDKNYVLIHNDLSKDASLNFSRKTHPSNLISNNIISYENKIGIDCLLITTECFQPNSII